MNDDKEKTVKHVNIQEKLINISNTAMSRYNELIGFTEIDQAYQKVTALQVKSCGIVGDFSKVQSSFSCFRSRCTVFRMNGRWFNCK